MSTVHGILMYIGPDTKFIISTSGRLTSLLRYKKLLQDILKLNIAYICIKSCDDAPIDPANFSNVLKGMNCIGGAISKDIKNSIIPYLDSMDDIAASCQSVNTVIVENGKLHGYNTDAIGFKIAIEKVLSTSPVPVKNAVCYGYGGVTSVVACVLKSLGLHVFLVGRRMEEATKRAEELSVQVWNSATCAPGFAQLFVNAAPVTDKPLAEGINFLSAIKGNIFVTDYL